MSQEWRVKTGDWFDCLTGQIVVINSPANLVFQHIEWFFTWFLIFNGQFEYTIKRIFSLLFPLEAPEVLLAEKALAKAEKTRNRIKDKVCQVFSQVFCRSFEFLIPCTKSQLLYDLYMAKLMVE